MSEFLKQKQPESVLDNLSYGIDSQSLNPSAIDNWGSGLNGREELILDVNIDKNPEEESNSGMLDDVFAARRARQAESEHQPGKVESFFRAIGAKALGKGPRSN